MRIIIKTLALLTLITVQLVKSDNRYRIHNCEVKEDSKVACGYTYREKKDYNADIPVREEKIIKELTLTIETLGTRMTGELTHLKLVDSTKERFEVPRYVLSEDFLTHQEYHSQIGGKVAPSTNSVILINPNTQYSLFELFKNELVFAEDYISFDYTFPSDYIFGYGERATKFKLKKGIYTTWANDTGLGSIEDDGLGGKNLYGSHPFIMVKNPMGSYIGVLFLNSNPQELEIKEGGLARQITAGGIIEIFAWSKNSAEETIQVYHNIIGKPALPPFWSLGWHQSKWGFSNTQEMQSVIDNYLKYEIPLDTLWADIDYMDKFQDFSIDPSNFGDLSNLVAKAKEDHGIHFVPILDIGIPNDPDNFYYKLGLELNAFIISNYTGKPLVNKVWPGECVFPDYTNYRNASLFWSTGLLELSNKLDYDGLWLDMNEPGTFVDGEVLEDAEKDETKNMYANLTYVPGNNFISLTSHGLSVNGLLHSNAPFNHVFNLKSLNTFLQNKITHKYLRFINKRPFILSRSSFVGMGKYSNHWLGDNFSTWESMRNSISGIFNFQMFGFNLVGADICGFLQDTTDSLCARWSTLGAFYPFARNHNSKGQTPQEPWSLGQLTLNSTKKALQMRYSILRYLYSQFYLSSTEGGMVFQPLFFKFNSVDSVLEDDYALNYQIMVGPALLFSPALEEKTDDYSALFPYANWNNFPSGEAFLTTDDFPDGETSSKRMSLSGSYDVINLHMRGGNIIPYQDAAKNKILNTRDSQNLHTTLIINPNQSGKADGEVFFDDPNSDPEVAIKEKKYLRVGFVMFSIAEGVKFNVINYFDYQMPDAYIEKVVVFVKEKESLSNLRISRLRFLKNQLDGNKIEINENSIVVTLSKPLHIATIDKIDLI